MFFEEVAHFIKGSEAALSCCYLLECPVRESLFDRLQISTLRLASLLCGSYEGFEFRFGVVYVGLIYFPLFLTALILSDILLRIVFKHGVLASGELRYSISENILIFFKHTVYHAVGHHLFAVHDAVSDSTFSFQTLVCGHIKTVLYAETQNPDRLAHFLMQITLSQNTTVALGIVHRSVGSIEMDQSMQPFLYVYACTESECRTEYHPNLATVHFGEDFKFLLVGYAGLHDNNLFSRDTFCNEFALDVLIDVESALVVLVVVCKYGDSSFV